MGTGRADAVIDLQRWAKQTPGGRDPYDVLVELDAIQRDAAPAAGRAGRGGRASATDTSAAVAEDRRTALDVLVRRGVLTAQAADAAAAAPVGESAATASRPRGRARPTALPTRIVEDRPADPGAVVGVALVALAPVSVVVAVLVGLDRVVGDAASTALLLAGVLVLAVSGGRGLPNAPRRIGRLSPVALRWVAALGALSPVLVFGVAVADPSAASEYVGWFYGVQWMMVLALVAFSEIARTQDWRARGGRSADARIERGEPVRVDVGAFVGVGLVIVAPLVAAASLFTALPPVPGAWSATAVLVAGAIVLGASAGRADSLAPSRRGRLSSRALVWIVVAAAVTPVVQFAVILANLDGPAAAMRICLSVQTVVVIAMILLPMIARRQERGGPLRD
ncbi:hypothetical protein [Agromyces sp. NPDC058064]|uniref:hypothetical protein n=1 Tax=Agromyces sp. NPDC058064 TaxID=3346322 RepID=UPI0036D8C4FE